VLFADIETKSIKALLSICNYRRQVQLEHNTKHGITPKTIRRAVQESLNSLSKARELEENVLREGGGGDFIVTDVIRELEGEMAEAATKLEFERAALIRDQIRELKKQAGMNPDDGGALPQPKKVTYAKPKRGGRKGK
jgi:excinuclease ABC subunit B